MRTPPTPGQRVRLTGEHLRNTGQVVGGEGQARWLVVACPCGICASGRVVAVDQASEFDPTQPRHIAVGALERVRA
jgi:hypothetical protein